MGTSKQAGEDGVSTTSLLGCSTSVALATGPTDKDEVEERYGEMHMYKAMHGHCFITAV